MITPGDDYPIPSDARTGAAGFHQRSHFYDRFFFQTAIGRMVNRICRGARLVSQPRDHGRRLQRDSRRRAAFA